VAGVVSYTPAADYNGPDSFSYTMADDGTTNGVLDAKSDTATVSVTVTEVNDKPVLTAGADQTVDEGSTVTIAPTWTDVDGVSPYSVTVDWGDTSSTALPSSTSGDAITHVYADNKSGNAPYTVTIQVKDSGTTNGVLDRQTDSKALSVTVRNVAPVVAQPSASTTPSTGVTTLSATFTDVGTPDTFPSGGFTVTSGTGTPTFVPGTIVRSTGGGGGTMTATTRLPVGCYTMSVTASVTDDDAGTSSSPNRSYASTDVYAASFKEPIKDTERNIAKYGNVVPIKVQLNSSCSGQLISTPSLFITIADGNAADIDPDSTPVIVAESVSSADSGTQMRMSGGMYIYNFATKTLTQGKDYTIRIREGSSTGPIILRALFQPKK